MSSPPTAVYRPTLPSPRFFLGLLRLSGIAAAAAERGCSLGSAVTRLGDCTGGSLLLPGLLPPAKSEVESLQLGFLCRKPESGLGRKVDSSPG